MGGTHSRGRLAKTDKSVEEAVRGVRKAVGGVEKMLHGMQ